MRNDFFEEFYKTMNRMNKIFEEMDKMFYEDKQDVFGLTSGREKNLIETKRMPVSKLEDKNKEIIATVELPGVDKEDIDVNISENKLEIKAGKKQEKKGEKKGVETYSLNEIEFYRCIRLPEKIDTNKVIANFKNGVLNLKMPKQKQTEVKKIQIE